MAAIMVAMSFTGIPSSKNKISVFFDHYVGDSLLQLDARVYKNDLGQPYTITKLRYYIGHIRLEKASGKKVFFDDYYLIDEEEEQSKKIIKDDVPTGTYTSMSFTIGVDSADNCSGAQSGALDPVNAMFWAWNTGYIFLKLEGKAPASQSPCHIFEYHIGGYRQPYNCVRYVTLKFSTPLTVSNAGENKEIHIKADIAEILKNPVNIDFSKLSSVTDFHNATTIADNYKDMFSISKIR